MRRRGQPGAARYSLDMLRRPVKRGSVASMVGQGWWSLVRDRTGAEGMRVRAGRGGGRRTVRMGVVNRRRGVVRWVGAGLMCAGDGRPHLHRRDGGARGWYGSSGRRQEPDGRTRGGRGVLPGRSRGGRVCWVNGWMSLRSRCHWWTGRSQRRPARRRPGGVVAGDPES
jgi:hypothetical protein